MGRNTQASGAGSNEQPEQTELLARCILMGRRLKALREAAGLGQIALARRSGLGQTTISALERGLYDAKAETVLRLAVALNVQPEIIVGHEMLGDVLNGAGSVDDGE